ncbi:Protein of unknown function [Marinactinospora thermotolerans DSM 45154]|uniref:DUF3352 domain-containing protein n=1 Tax=Marinactinospora thermotolerans DSM 45154 TaxID=1122192 RepID=A0A1T4SY72_9ACTN|nr:DUF3352 domain-containing protein [Marinactinospora thermotolerans]SKA33069.1 Protein of unknown function [Marinactinospora thermotolerans DSM 45154]
MSYPDPPNQPSWPSAPPPGGQAPPPGAPFPPPQPSGPRSRAWLIPVAAGLSVVLMGTTVWASSALVDNVFGGAQPESALPASAIVFAELDLKPTGRQWASYAQFAGKLPDTLKNELGDVEEGPARQLVEEAFPELDYDSEVEPWLGRRFGLALWPTSTPGASLPGDEGLALALAVAVEDEEAAGEALAKVRSRQEHFFFEVDDDFALLSYSQGALDDLAAQMEAHGSLADAPDYSSDMNAIGSDNIASAWADLAAAAEVATTATGLSSPYGTGPDDFGEVSGRLAMALRIEGDYLELRGDAFEVTYGGSPMEGLAGDDPGLSELAELPDDSVLAVGGDNLDTLATRLWEDNRELLEEIPEFPDFEMALAEMGVSLPGDFPRLLGSRTAFAITGSLAGSSDSWSSGTSFQYRAAGADRELFEDLLAGSGGGPAPGVSDDGGTVVVSYGTTGTGRLGDDPLFGQTMAGLEKSNIGFYLDVRDVLAAEGQGDAAQWGALGGSVSYDDEGNSSLVARWAPSGGA